jgi:hypothetical protein
MERAMGIEPTSEAWEASILPLYDARSPSKYETFLHLTQLPQNPFWSHCSQHYNFAAVPAVIGVHITSDRGNYKLVGMSKDNFPALPAFPYAMIKIPASLLGAGGFRGHLVRLAQPRTQSDELTAWISNATANSATFSNQS